MQVFILEIALAISETDNFSNGTPSNREAEGDIVNKRELKADGFLGGGDGGSPPSLPSSWSLGDEGEQEGESSPRTGGDFCSPQEEELDPEDPDSPSDFEHKED